MVRITVIAIAAVSLLGVQSGQVVRGAHPSWTCLNVVPEHTYATNTDDEVETLLAYPGVTDAGHPPEHEGCVTDRVEPDQDWAGAEVHFEVIEDADGDSPIEPDMSCTVAAGEASCEVAPPDSDDGTQTIRGWLASVEADLTEAPEHNSDTDATDVVLWHWSQSDPGACAPYVCGPTDVTIRYVSDQDSFKGRVRSPLEGCRGQRTLKVRKRLDGPDRTIGFATSKAEGSWAFDVGDRRRGRFYAVATRSIRDTSDPSRQTECLWDRSRVITIG